MYLFCTVGKVETKKTEKFSLVIIEDSKEMCNIIVSNLDKSDRFEVLATAHNGLDGLNAIHYYLPDVILLDIILPIKDGMDVLLELSNSNIKKRPACVVLSSISKEEVTQEAMLLGADYFVLKPFDVNMLIKRLIHICENRENNNCLNNYIKINVENVVDEMLFKVGIPINLKGYSYLKNAIIMCYEDKKALDGLTKVVYPEIGKKFDTDCGCVERAIRHAISSCWSKGYGDRFSEVIGYKSLENKKPTNGAFISAAINTISKNG